MLEERGSGGTGEGLTTRRRILGLASSLSTATRDNLTSGRQGRGVRDSCCLTRTQAFAMAWKVEADWSGSYCCHTWRTVAKFPK